MASGLLEQRRALVTGATSGIGAAIAGRFVAAGAQVALSGRDRDRAEAVARRLSPTAGPTVPILLGDVASAAQADAIVAGAAEAMGGLDIVVNAAGVITRGTAGETSDADWQLNMSVNAGGVFNMCRAALTRMVDQTADSDRDRAIVNIASNVGLVGSRSLAAYCASKGAVVALTKAMALDHAPDGIRINALCPGAVDTPMLFSGHRTGLGPAEVMADNEVAIPLGRIATVEEVADAALFLASSLATHITGVCLPIDGGYVAG